MFGWLKGEDKKEKSNLVSFKSNFRGKLRFQDFQSVMTGLKMALETSSVYRSYLRCSSSDVVFILKRSDDIYHYTFYKIKLFGSEGKIQDNVVFLNLDTDKIWKLARLIEVMNASETVILEIHGNNLSKFTLTDNIDQCTLFLNHDNTWYPVKKDIEPILNTQERKDKYIFTFDLNDLKSMVSKFVSRMGTNPVANLNFYANDYSSIRYEDIFTKEVIESMSNTISKDLETNISVKVNVLILKDAVSNLIGRNVRIYFTEDNKIIFEDLSIPHLEVIGHLGENI